jgi:hypothetical protein
MIITIDCNNNEILIDDNKLNVELPSPWDTLAILIAVIDKMNQLNAHTDYYITDLRIEVINEDKRFTVEEW